VTEEEVTIVGKFINDISGPAARAEESIRELDNANDDLHTSSVRSTHAQRQQRDEMGRFARVSGDAARGATRVERQMRRLDESLGDGRSSGRRGGLTRRTKDSTSAWTKMKNVLGGLWKVIGYTKIPLLIGGVTTLIPAVTALSGELVGVVGALAPMSGLVMAFPAAAVGFLSVLGTMKVGLSGVGEAMKVLSDPKATIEQINEAFKELGPNATKFAVQGANIGREWKKTTNVVREALTGELIGPMKQLADTYMPRLQGSMEGVAHSLGAVVNRFTALARTKQALTDFDKLSKANARNVKVWGDTTVNFGVGFRGWMVAAIPMIDKFSTLIQKISQHFMAWSNSKRGRDSLTRFFDRTYKVTTGVVRTLKDFAVGLWNIMSLGTGLGDSLGKSTGDIAENFRKWTQSDAGRARIKKFFDDIHPVITAVAHFLGSILTALVNIGSNSDNLNTTKDVFNTLAGLGPALKIAGNTILQDVIPAIGTIATGLANAFTWADKIKGPFGELAKAALAIGAVLGIKNAPAIASKIGGSLFERFFGAKSRGASPTNPMYVWVMNSLGGGLPGGRPVGGPGGGKLVRGLRTLGIKGGAPAAISGTAWGGAAVAGTAALDVATVGTALKGISNLPKMFGQMGLNKQVNTLYGEFYNKEATPQQKAILDKFRGDIYAGLQRTQKQSTWDKLTGNVHTGMLEAAVKGVTEALKDPVAVKQFSSTGTYIAGVVSRSFLDPTNQSKVQAGVDSYLNNITAQLGFTPIMISAADQRAHKGRWAGGPVWPGEKFNVGELQPEVFLGRSGKTRLLGAHGQEQTTFDEPGVVIPSVRLANRALAPQGRGGPMQVIEHTPHLTLQFTEPVNSEVDIERAALMAHRRLQQEQAERGIKHGGRS
jgi:hypothetical protein